MRFFPRERRRRIWVLAVLGIYLLGVLALGGWAMMMPGHSFKGPLPPLSAEQAQVRDRFKAHIRKIAGEIGERHLGRYAQLQQCAGYIGQTFKELRYPVEEQPFQAGGKAVRNISVELKGAQKPQEILVVGAHYDSVPDCPAANDNGSGVAAVLELARLLAGKHFARTVRLVAFVNEEAPYFGTEEMGSLVCARRCQKRKENVIGMLSLETIGCYSDAPGSQHYPAPFNLFYPDTGNFIGFVGNVGSHDLVRRTVGAFRRLTQFPSEAVAAPANLEGISWSDHWAFWQAGYPALMVTDTAPFRYPYYHTVQDTPDKLDYERTARVVLGLSKVIGELAGGG